MAKKDTGKNGVIDANFKTQFEKNITLKPVMIQIIAIIFTSNINP